jgi:hypothetical protein
MDSRVLFIGNSHTFFENLPWLFAEVCAQAGIDVQVFMLTYPGVDLGWHLSSFCALPNIRFGGYDFVVLQQKSHPFSGAETLAEQGREFYKAISASDSTTVFMNTWSEKRNPAGQKVIDDAFTQLQSLCPGSLVAPCGAAWHKLRGVIDLYFMDGEHQNSKGAYLNACVLAKTIYGINPIELPLEIKTGILSMELSKDEIRLLQETTASV